MTLYLEEGKIGSMTIAPTPVTRESQYMEWGKSIQTTDCNGACTVHGNTMHEMAKVIQLLGYTNFKN